jgi:hypothetical protein
MNSVNRLNLFQSFHYSYYSFGTVFLCLVLSVLATIAEYEKVASNVLMYTVSKEGVCFKARF